MLLARCDDVYSADVPTALQVCSRCNFGSMCLNMIDNQVVNFIERY